MDKKTIRDTRHMHHLTQRQCAQMIHVSVATWKNYENDRSHISRGLWELFLLRIGENSVEDTDLIGIDSSE